MSEQFFAEATVKIGPDLTGFATDLTGKLNTALRDVEKRNPKVRIGPALTKNFIGSLTEQVNVALRSVQKNVASVRVGPALTRDFTRDLTLQVDAAVARVKAEPVRVGVVAEHTGPIQTTRPTAPRTDLGLGADFNRQAEEALRKRDAAIARTQQKQQIAPVVEQKRIAKDAHDAAVQITALRNEIAKIPGSEAAVESLDATLKGLVATENAATQGAERLAATLQAGGTIRTPDVAQARQRGATKTAQETAQILKQTSAQKGLQTAIRQTEAIERAGIRAKTESGKATDRVRATEKALATSTATIGKARAEGNNVLARQAVTLTRELRKQLATEEQALEPARVADVQARARANAEKLLARSITQRVDAERAGAASTTAVGRTQAVIRGQEVAAGTARSAAREALASGDAALFRQINAEKRLQVATLRTADVRLAEAKAIDAMSAAQTRLSLVSEAGVGATTAAAIAHAKAGAAEAAHAEASKALELALKTENAAIIANAQALELETKAAAQAAVAEAERLRGQRGRAQQTSQIQKGALATSLSFVGLRGATLAASKSFLIGAAAIAIFQKAIGSTVKFEQQLNVFQATAGATAEQMERVRVAARALGADITLPAVSSADAAEAMTELSKAGLSVTDSIAGARGVLQLATAAAIDNAKAVELAASALNAFQLQGRDASHVADVFANAANQAQGSIEDIGSAFTQAAAAGRQAGLSFEDTSLFLTVLARNGLRGSDAGTSLRTALIRLIKPTDAAQAAINKLGISIRDEAGNIRPDIFLQITSAMQGLPKAQKDATIALLGGQDAFRAISILGRGTIQDFIRLRRELRQNGTAADLAAARTKGLAGAGDALASTLETVGVQLGRNFSPGLNTAVRGLTDGVNAMSQSETVAATLQGTFSALTISVHALATVFGTLGPPLLTVADAALKLTNAIGVPEILAAVAAYKLLPASVTRATAALKALKSEYVALGAVQVAESAVILPAGARATTSAVTATTKLKAVLGAAARSFNIYALAAGVAAAGLFFLLTRQSAVEKATKRLAAATNDLASATSSLDSAQSASALSSHSVNAAREELVNARIAAASARRDLANTNAASNSFARRKAELGLAVALDNVAIAQQKLTDVQDEATTSAEGLLAAQTRRAQAVDEEIASLNKLREANLARIQEESRGRAARATGSPGQAFESRNDQRASSQKAITESILQTAEAIKKQALEERNSDDASIREIAKRKQAYAELTALLQRKLTPTEIDIIFNSNSVTAALKNLEQRFREDGNQKGVIFIESLISGMGLGTKLPDAIDAGVRSAHTAELTAEANQLGNKIADDTADGIRAHQGSIVSALQDALKTANTAVARDATRLLLAQGQGVGLTGQLAIAQGQLADANRALAKAKALLGKGESPSRRKAFDDAVAQQAAAAEQVRQLQEQISSEAKQAASDAASRSAQQTQDFIDSFADAEQKRKNAITTASFTPLLNDDIAANVALKNFYIAERKQIQDRIKTMKLHGDALKAAQAAINALNQSIFDTQNEINTLVQNQQDRIKQKLDLRIQIAEVHENIKAQIRLHRQKLAEIQKELSRLRDQRKKNTVEWFQLKLDEANEQKAIADLLKQRKDAANTFAQLSFQFLTTQQGFDANLLGNLVGTGAIGNTVAGRLASGTSGATGATAAAAAAVGLPPNVRLPQEHGHGIDPHRTVGSVGKDQAIASAITSAANTGPTRGQQSVQLTLLRQILSVLQAIRRGDDHPEHHRSKKNSNAVLDTHK